MPWFDLFSEMMILIVVGGFECIMPRLCKRRASPSTLAKRRLGQRPFAKSTFVGGVLFGLCGSAYCTDVDPAKMKVQR